MAAEFCETCKPNTRAKCRSCPRLKKPLHYPTRCGMSVVDNLRFMARWYWLQDDNEEEHY